MANTIPQKSNAELDKKNKKYPETCLKNGNPLLNIWQNSILPYTQIHDFHGWVQVLQ